MAKWPEPCLGGISDSDWVCLPVVSVPGRVVWPSTARTAAGGDVQQHDHEQREPEQHGQFHTDRRAILLVIPHGMAPRAASKTPPTVRQRPAWNPSPSRLRGEHGDCVSRRPGGTAGRGIVWPAWRVTSCGWASARSITPSTRAPITPGSRIENLPRICGGWFMTIARPGGLGVGPPLGLAGWIAHARAVRCTDAPAPAQPERESPQRSRPVPGPAGLG